MVTLIVRRIACVVVSGLFLAALPLRASPTETERHYLSGRGPNDAVPWEFTVSGGRRAGEKTTIPVPSHWEQHGFGAYNYGQTAEKSDERGSYATRFALPPEWKGRRIRLVFGAAMTDTTVKLNGRSAGPIHQGGFTQFRYEITPLVKFDGENLLEVTVAKVSADANTERAERGGDYWVFGGIYRPVWLEASPAVSIEHVAIDARADGALTADVTLTSLPAPRPDGPALLPERVEAQLLDADGKPVGESFSTKIPAGGIGRLRIANKFVSPRLWTAETPNLYSLRISRLRGDETLHTVTTRFGFRTFEVRDGEGFFLNGQRILLKGVNRHSFRPDTGRALTREDCYADVRLLRQMNMNAVRMSHYPPDEAFLEACDEIGLYVLDELSGWQHAHGTTIGRLLVRELVERDVNHPSIIFWDNGNEGGWNRDLDGDYALYDPQQRRVLHPWDPFGGVDTKHYTTYDDHVRRLRGPNLVMPTEIIHALYDGGGAAGMEDYWRAIENSPFGAGAFIWVLADEGIARTDQGGRVDVFSTYAPDGVVGPRHEKKGSFYTLRDLWSPVQIAAPVLDPRFHGKLAVTNRYDFTSLAQCRFAWKLLRHRDPAEKETAPTILAEGNIASPAIAPHATGQLALSLPANWQDADALSVVAVGPDQQELFTWSWPTPALAKRVAQLGARKSDAAPKVDADASGIRLIAGDVTADFDPVTALLRSVRRGAQVSALANGPRLAFARPETAGAVEWLAFASEDPATQIRRLASPLPANVIEVELDFDRTAAWASLKVEISPDGQAWKTIHDSSRRAGDGKSYIFPPQVVAAIRLSHALRPTGEPIAIKSARIGYAPARFPADSAAPVKISSGIARDEQTGENVAWLESRGAAGLDRSRWTLRGDGSLRVDYSYALAGEFLYHGITFDHPEEKMKSLRWLGAGPTRVWQNRLRGPWLGVHEIARNDIQPGEAWTFPEFQGCFAGLRWARLDTASGPLTVTSASPEIYLRIGTPRVSHQNTTVLFPSGDVSFLHAIPAIGSKFITPEKTGPASLPAKASGNYEGSLTFRFGL
ncbi:MAG TPA: glycoside hydrolase family 2 TIM barrel-domain containing protein [Opitutaceae bacterium]|nr:glycoside hydrolase family 2 TIM barrel-domain containing protein [Opitutaceae bacterium]